MRSLGFISKCSILLFVSVAACGGSPDVTNPKDRTAERGGGKTSPSSGGRSGKNEPGLFAGTSNSGGNGNECTGDDCKPSSGGASAVGEYCGNGRLDTGETCDDGNAKPGDGCDGNCGRESGYDCDEPGKPCTTNEYCSDGKPGPGEACDDGNTTNDDGCSSACAIEPGSRCDGFGPGTCTKSTSTPVCGNGDVEFGETCDDGGQDPNDGCNATCQQDVGWLCPKAGERCVKNEYCGDSLVNGQEK